MNKLKHIEVECPLFKCDLHYIINCSHKELEKYCKKHFDMEGDYNIEWLKTADGATFTLQDEEGLYRIVWLVCIKVLQRNSS